MAALESVVESINKGDGKVIDREKTCPLLLRVFCSTGRHNSLQEYNEGGVPANELQIYTWMDASLKELAQLVREVNPQANQRGTVFDFSLVYIDRDRPRATYRARSVGTTISQTSSLDDKKTLASIQFCIGDFLDICITPPSRVLPPSRDRRRY